jgi:hypothetical protein
MTTRTLTAPRTNEPAHVPANLAGDSALLTETDLDAVAGGGGPAGANPSRGTLRA